MEQKEKTEKRKSMVVREQTWARVDQRVGFNGHRTVDSVLTFLLDEFDRLTELEHGNDQKEVK